MSDPMPETRETPQVMVVRCLHCNMIVQDFGGGCFECGRVDGLRGTEATLFGRDALVMDWARKIIAYTKAGTMEPPADLVTLQRLDRERIAAWKALSAFDAAQEGDKDGK